jgi:hypothetical protein
MDMTIPIVISTTEYGTFKTIKGNRGVLSYHVAHLMTSISKKNLLPAYPIVINENNEIIDGQHRLMAAKGLNLPIYYVKIPGLGLNDVQSLNTYIKPWRGKDYLESFCLVGLPKYKAFRDFIELHEVTIEQGLILITGDTSHGIYTTFKEGKLDYTAAQLKSAEDKATLMDDLRLYFVDRGFTSNYWPRAINVVFEKELVTELLLKADRVKPRLERKHSRKDYLRMLEDVINFYQGKNLFRLL